MEILKWEKKFAFLPVRTQQGDLRWLQFVMRKNIDREGGTFYIYTDCQDG